MNTPETIEFPFMIKSDLTDFVIAEDLHVIKMDNESKKRLLGIGNAEYGDNGMLRKCRSYPNDHLRNTPGSSVVALLHFQSSNYKLIAPSRERAAEFNLALKLAEVSSTTLYIGYCSSSRGSEYIPQCYFDLKLPALTVTQDEAFFLKNLVAQIASSCDDEKFRLMSEIYLHAMSDKIRPGSRFIELSIILEMLLLPKQESELSYRFSLRLAKFMAKHFNCSIDSVFKNGKQIYKTRSHVVHNGQSTELESTTPIVHEYTRKLLSAYLKDKTLFDNQKLEELCLN